MHRCKANQKVYIGITSQEPQRRWQNGKGYIGSTLFYNAILKYGWDGFEHIILFSGLTKEDAFEKEVELIALYKSNNREFGYNIAPGGKDNTHCIKARKGKDNPRSTEIVQIDPTTMNVVAIYETQTMASKVLGINRKGITKACRGECKTYKGYIWEYRLSDYVKPTKPSRGKYEHIKQMKSVCVTYPNGKSYIFSSINEASEFTKESRTNISRYLSGVRNDSQKRRWSFVF